MVQTLRTLLRPRPKLNTSVNSGQLELELGLTSVLMAFQTKLEVQKSMKAFPKKVGRPPSPYPVGSNSISQVQPVYHFFEDAPKKGMELL